MNFTKNTLAKAVSMAIAGTALAVGASSAMAATTMYNTYNAGGLNADTDGWTHTGGVGNGGGLQPWLGTTGFNSNPSDPRPFDYAGQAALSWAVQLNGSGDTAIISAQDSTKYSSDPNYTGPAEIDTGGGAWQDNSATPTGWKHQTDIGLIRSDVTQSVTLYLATTGQQAPTFSLFGVTVFDGMDTTPTSTATYSHHGAWNCPTCAVPKPFTNSNPWYLDASGNPIGTGMTNIQYNNAVDAVNGITFTAQAGQVYTIALGGVGFSHWGTGLDGYILGVNTAPVPVPAAVWLLGSALMGMGVIGRRKEKIIA
jgi:hypothetical protein